MRLWIDLANSPHVPFFRALREKFVTRGHEVEVTARDFAETVPLAEAAGLSPHVLGGYGGKKITGKAGNLSTRAWALATWARRRSFDLAVSHNSYSQILAARALRLKNELFDETIAAMQTHANVKIVLLPRNESQRTAYTALTHRNLIVPKVPLDGANLIAASDLVVSAGGTINREAAALGVPAASIYQGQWAAVDEQLVHEGRLLRISTVSDFEGVPLHKKRVAHPRAATEVIDEVVSFILE